MPRTRRKNQTIQPTQTSTEVVFCAAIYVRLSVMDDARKSDGESIQNQQELLERYVSDSPELILKKVFVDNGRTGVNFERPAWKSLMRECRFGNINCIVIKDLSRLGRNYIETGDYLERVLPALGIRLIAVNDGYDSLSLTNGKRLVSNLKNLVNDIYSKDISRKVITAIRTKQRNGEFIGGYAAYGYLKDPLDPKKIIVNPDTAPIVKNIFEMKAEGLGNGAICQKLNSEGIPCPARYRYLKGFTQNRKHENSIWIVSTISGILRNPLYLGHMTQGKMQRSLCEGKDMRKTRQDEWIIVPDTHEAIVSKELYDFAHAMCHKRAGEYMKRRYINPGDQAKRMELILFRVAFCADCGKALARKKLEKKKDGTSRWGFVCKKYTELKACTKKFIHETELYEAVYHAIRCQVGKYADPATVLDKLGRGNDYITGLMRYDAKIQVLEQAMRRLSSRREGLYEDYAAKLLTASEYQFATNKYSTDIKKQISLLETAQKEREKYLQNAPHDNIKTANFMAHRTLTSAMVHAFVARVEVSGLNRVSIILKFQDELESHIIPKPPDSANDTEVAL